MNKITMLIFTALFFSGVLNTQAAPLNFGGQTFESVDWTSVDVNADTATGTAGSVGVTFNAVNIANANIFTADYTTDPAFDALTYPSGGTLEALRISGASGFGSSDSLTFDSAVSAILMIIGSPADTDAVEFGPSQWEFDNALSMSVVDNELIGANNLASLALLPGNLLVNLASNGTFNQGSGVVLVNGSFTSLSWLHAISGIATADVMNVTFAVATDTVAPVPIPTALPLFAGGLGLLGLLGWRRKRMATAVA